MWVCDMCSLERVTNYPQYPAVKQTLILSGHKIIEVEKIDTKRPLNFLKHTVSMQEVICDSIISL